jgi:hypothetical protein
MQLNDFLNEPKFRELKRMLSKKDNTASLDELLFQPNFKELNQFLVHEMNVNAGYEVLSKMKEIFKDDKQSFLWFYGEWLSLKNSRPYDYCKTGKRQEVYDELIRIEHGIFS